MKAKAVAQTSPAETEKPTIEKENTDASKSVNEGKTDSSGKREPVINIHAKSHVPSYIVSKL